ncbi:hypothetical protein BKA56DRAFT_616049 [Ilyonectria sp. MPI-CAGE-AT-0026]|nr:hypothetical protein BKA56DRAFT_616049 [Ilyonectria sp. MPI-CAGE-AT-0026]
MCLDRDLAWLGAASSAPSFNPSAASTSSTTLHHLSAINLPGHPLLWTYGESPPSKRSCHAQLDHSGKPHAGRCTAFAGGWSPRIVSIPGLQHHAAGIPNPDAPFGTGRACCPVRAAKLNEAVTGKDATSCTFGAGEFIRRFATMSVNGLTDSSHLARRPPATCSHALES